jgi:hypothetical protein
VHGTVRNPALSGEALSGWLITFPGQIHHLIWLRFWSASLINDHLEIQGSLVSKTEMESVLSVIGLVHFPRFSTALCSWVSPSRPGGNNPFKTIECGPGKRKEKKKKQGEVKKVTDDGLASGCRAAKPPQEKGGLCHQHYYYDNYFCVSVSSARPKPETYGAPSVGGGGVQLSRVAALLHVIRGNKRVGRGLDTWTGRSHDWTIEGKGKHPVSLRLSDNNAEIVDDETGHQ